MAILIGQVFYPRYEEKQKDGETKISFSCSLGTRKAFIDDPKKPNLFTPCVTHQPGLAKLFNEFFGKEEHHGKSVVFYGHYNEYKWSPDPDNKDHDKYFQEFTITEDILSQGGVKFAEGSQRQVTIFVPIEQTTRQFVVTGFEFADSNTGTAKPSGNKEKVKIKVGGQSPSADNSTPSGEGKPANVGQDGVPF